MRFIRDDRGATAVEYGLLAAVIAVGILASVRDVREALKAVFNTIATEMNTVSSEANQTAPVTP